ncbi:MAG: dihydrofolate reductase [Bacteroidales bacterium]
MNTTQPRIAIIVAMDQNRAIGLRGDMPWRLSADLKRFKRITLGHPVIMGRRTFESLPGGALPGRHNIVVTRNISFAPEGVTVANTPEKALEICAGEPIVFIIGGGELYRYFLPVADLLYLTTIENTWEADTWFPEIDMKCFSIISTQVVRDDPAFPFAYRFTDLERISEHPI